MTRKIVTCPTCKSKDNELTPTGKLRTHTRGKRAVIQTPEGRANRCAASGLTPDEARAANAPKLEAARAVNRAKLDQDPDDTDYTDREGGALPIEEINPNDVESARRDHGLPARDGTKAPYR